jgi:hypothetical protein
MELQSRVSLSPTSHNMTIAYLQAHTETYFATSGLFLRYSNFLWLISFDKQDRLSQILATHATKLTLPKHRRGCVGDKPKARLKQAHWPVLSILLPQSKRKPNGRSDKSSDGAHLKERRKKRRSINCCTGQKRTARRPN